MVRIITPLRGFYGLFAVITIANLFLFFDRYLVLPLLFAIINFIYLIVAVYFVLKTKRKKYIIGMILLIVINTAGWAIPHLYGYFIFRRPVFLQGKQQADRLIRQALKDNLAHLQKQTPQAKVNSYLIFRKQYFYNYFTPLPKVYQESLKPEAVRVNLTFKNKRLRIALTEKWLQAALQQKYQQAFSFFRAELPK
jgi:hypothetical protein